MVCTLYKFLVPPVFIENLGNLLIFLNRAIYTMNRRKVFKH